MESQQLSDNEDMNVELDDEDIQYNIEESRKPIDPELNDEQEISDIQAKINRMEAEEYFEDDGSETEDIIQQNAKWKRYYGNYFTLAVINDEPVFAISYQFIINIIGLVILGGLNYLQLHAQQSDIQFIITMVICILEFLGYLICSILNPGLYTAQYEINVRNVSCNICNVVHYNHDTHHCPTCDVCIREFHHHSLIFGKCIGQGNVFYYYLTVVIFPMYMINLLMIIML